MLKTTVPLGVHARPQQGLCPVISLCFLCSHGREYLFSRTCTCFLHWRVPSSFLDVPIQHALAFIGKVVTGWLPRILLEYVTSIHMSTKRYPDIWRFVRTQQETHRTRQTKALFRTRCNASEMGVLFTVKAITGGGLRASYMSMQEAPITCQDGLFITCCTNALPS